MYSASSSSAYALVYIEEGGEGIVHSSTRHFGQRRHQRRQGFPAKEHRNELGHPFYTDEWSEGFGPQRHERNGVRGRPILRNI
jgi:hypothetical protein